MKAHRLVYHSTLGVRVTKKRSRRLRKEGADRSRLLGGKGAPGVLAGPEGPHVAARVVCAAEGVFY